jgi:AcrR family transcriptional regulator
MAQEAKRPPGRPQGGRAFERSDIIEAALESIANGGYSGLTMRGVARSIGASLATVQRHFATRDDLWRGAADAFLDGFTTRDGPRSGPPLAQGIADILDRGSAHPGLITSILCDQAPGHLEGFAYIAQFLVERHEATLSTITGLQDDGVVREVDASALVLLLNVGIGAIASAPTATREIYGFNLEDPEQRVRLADALADILYSGLAHR